MFQTTFLLPSGVTIFHPPEILVSRDMLFEEELLFVWDELMDPHFIKKELGRFVPFVFAVIEHHQREISNNWEQWEYSLKKERGSTVQGVVLLGLCEEDFDILDKVQSTPIHRIREKIKCRIGNMERTVNAYLQQGALLE